MGGAVEWCAATLIGYLDDGVRGVGRLSAGRRLASTARHSGPFAAEMQREVLTARTRPPIPLSPSHKKVKAETIRAIVTPTASDAELLEFAIQRNATHGLQLSQEDKRDMARRILLAVLLSVSERTVRDWLSRIDKDAKEARDRRIFDLWLACWTQEQIASELSVSQGEIAKIIPNGDIAVLNKTDRASADHSTEFAPPLYNVWKQQEKTNGRRPVVAPALAVPIGTSYWVRFNLGPFWT